MNFELWSRALNVIYASNLRRLTQEETEKVLEIGLLRKKEGNVFMSEKQLKNALIVAYNERRQKILKLEKILVALNNLDSRDKLRTDIKSIIFEENNDYSLNVESTITVSKKKK